MSSISDASESNYEELDPSPQVQTTPYYGSLVAKIREEDKATVKRLIRESRFLEKSQKRISQEIRSFHEDGSHPYLSIAPIDGWNNCLACIEGTPNSAFGGGVFWLRVKFPEDYPYKPLSVQFITPIFHPNVDEHRNILLDIFDINWSPCMQVETVLLSILSVMGSPELEVAASPEIAEIYTTDFESYYEIARIHTEAYAHEERPDEFELDSVIFTPPETVASSRPGTPRALSPEPLSSPAIVPWTPWE